MSGLATRSSMARVGLFLGALAAAGLEDRAPSRKITVGDFLTGWGRLAARPPALRPLRAGSSSAAEIFRQEAEAAGISVEVIKGRIRTTRVAYARHEAWRRMVDERGMGWSEIARLTGHNHTSVMHGVGRAWERRAGLLAPTK